ncbi:unnamed protein product [Knipowitschia caucasica]|uniref:Cystatin domain-containing protein n=2 Tax=Knipowitschia caucasica TaxID=637954 RepID=A0AAV2JKL9_KNICA
MKSAASVVIFAVFLSGAWCAMTGALKDMDVNDTVVQDALTFAVNKHNMGTNDVFRNDVVRVVKAQSQVVAGRKFIITVDMARTNCRKDRTNEVCVADPGAQTYQCTFTVWSRPWLKDIQLTAQTCS